MAVEGGGADGDRAITPERREFQEVDSNYLYNTL